MSDYIAINNQNSYGALANEGRDDNHDDNHGHSSALEVPFGSLLHAGGVNSLDRFASSFTRAQSFHVLDPMNSFQRERSVSTTFTHTDDEEAQGPFSPHSRYFEDAIDDDDASFIDNTHLLSPENKFVERRMTVSNEPQLVVRVEEETDGKFVAVVEGQSTAPQTIFNSVNLLIGIGLLSLPLGFKYTGWAVGTMFLLLCAFATRYSAGLLAKCLDTDKTLITYADIGYAAFGSRARLIISVLFSLELVGAGVSLVVLFADSLNALFPSISKLQYKLLAFVLLTPPTFLPLNILSFSSVMGIISTIGLVFIVFFDGLYKATTPGSLREPMETWIMPRDWSMIPLSIGIFMSPWGGHAVFPNIYRDMRHPQKYTACLNTVYKITFSADFAMGILGFLMFGAKVSEEITKNILVTEGYPAFLSYFVTFLISLIPLAKMPLTARPIVTTLDILFGLDDNSLIKKHQLTGELSSTKLNGIYKFMTRVGVNFLFLIMALVFPDFDRIIALVGSALCVTICLVLPVAFYLKIFKGQISQRERWLDYFILVASSVAAIVGTVASLRS
ncbi:hypothetical protein NADFUDRAFT_81536 [Nadsonia fulvescens var. elongata DSM 6958]|uniref:Amino acid transporter transmembrane domain-containing protein n=1 Tax=Nadsonia fulvescens var. elongata DSM 6958 TaxID=857566 RepID=A0A1E3PT90_9ASCO|nr:hypothetical protein NADFUDRAFT_81536 [Nadsonia fulvescens var. elongata DSM 6958]